VWGGQGPYKDCRATDDDDDDDDDDAKEFSEIIDSLGHAISRSFAISGVGLPRSAWRLLSLLFLTILYHFMDYDMEPVPVQDLWNNNNPFGGGGGGR
jgi:hypothetical protein